ncbi:MAG: TIGR03986 family CRISPR-associated RAMP protein [Chloroflexi bacterium]|nr:TIGR03986 family CRISPR-associated RAMP protein [Chloroflexota bacterium]
MALKHTNPTRQRQDRDGNRYTARAPYNFIPLTDKVVRISPDTIPDQDTFQEDSLTGWIDCEIETMAPTHIRGMMMEAMFRDQGLKKPDELTLAEKETRAPFFSSSDGKVEGQLQPIIPGSSLRGMIRQLVEVLGYGRIRWVADQPKMFFRAVAASKFDPLREPYNDLIGRFSKNVRAGYLLYDDQNNEPYDGWYILPAREWPTGETYIRIKDKAIQSLGLEGYIGFNDENYRPQIQAVSFEPETKHGKRGLYVQINALGARDAYRIKGNLVCAGNMLEAGDVGKTRSPRARQALMLLPDSKKQPVKIPPQTVRDYLDSLTTFQREQLIDWSSDQGCLGHLKPVFYILDRGDVMAFGHSPNFRVPALVEDENGNKRAATPYDFVSEEHKGRQNPDLADALFGWVEEADGPAGSRAGRVFFSDAHFKNAKDGVWMQMVTPHVLASPKPNTFQHYLVQDKSQGHDPDRNDQLAYYGSDLTTTQIRGVKHYWHRGHQPEIRATVKEKEHESQLTRIIPLKPGIIFTCRIRFENLKPEELGLLWWALALPTEDGRTFCHKIGMGKPLGMGGVAIRPKLTLTKRLQRYHTLFTSTNWQEAAEATDPGLYIDKFEQFILERISGSSFARQERIRMLLEMLVWREDDSAWTDATRYMEIEYGPRKLNEYKERPVLPDPLEVGK